MSRLSLPFHAQDISTLAKSLKGQIAATDRDPSHMELLNMLARSSGYRNFQHFRAQATAHQYLANPPPVPEPEPVDFVKVRRMLRYFDPDFGAANPAVDGRVRRGYPVPCRGKHQTPGQENVKPEDFRGWPADRTGLPVGNRKDVSQGTEARLFRAESSHANGRLIRWPSKRGHQELCLWVVWSNVPPRQVFSEPEINRQLLAWHLFGDYALLRRWLCDYGMMSRTVDGREYQRIERRPPADAVALIGHLRHG